MRVSYSPERYSSLVWQKYQFTEGGREMPSLSLRTWTLMLNNPETVTAEMDPSKMHIKRLHKGMVRMSSECLTPFNLMKMSSGCTPRLWAAETTWQKVSACPPASREQSTLSPTEPQIITFLDRGWGGFPDFPTGLCVITRVFTREGWRQESRGQTETGGAAGQEREGGLQTTDAGAQEAGDTKQRHP